MGDAKRHGGNPVRACTSDVQDLLPDSSAEALLDAVYEFDLEGRLTYANAAAKRLFGFAPDEEASALRLEETIVDEDRAGSQRDLALIRTGQSVRGERTFVSRSGRRFVGEVHSGPVIRNGEVVGVRGVLRDMSERRVAEQRLRESELRFKTLFELSPQPIAVSELHTGQLLDVNHKFCELSGYRKDEVIGRPTFELGILPLERRQQFAAALASRGEVRALPMDFSNRDGTRFETLVFARVLELFGQQVIVTVVLDLTLQRRLEAELLQAQKLEAIGALAGWIAHDFNNLLTMVGGLASLAGQRLDASHPVRELLGRIEEQVQSGSALTRQLLAYAHTGPYDAVPTDLNRIVERTADLFARTHEPVTVEVECVPAAWTVEVDRGQLEQVLLNLYLNAEQAMAGGGTIHIRTENLHLDELQARSHGLCAGRYLKISVADSGTGMDEATRSRVFEPFFTTKGLGRGTGLGLASAYGVIKNHRGAIEVWSRPGEGSRFDILLPATETPPEPEPEAPTTPTAGRGLVLLVDDEPAVARVGEAMLRELGYDVLVAHDGPSAIAAFERESPRVDLVMLDWVLRGMSGAQVFDRLRAIRPDVAVLLVTGFSAEQGAPTALRRAFRGRIQKPYRLGELAQQLAAILTGAGVGAARGGNDS